MVAAVKAMPGPGGIVLERVGIPKPGPGEVLLEVKAASLCGTDIHIYDWDSWAAQRVKIPLIQGHEFSGTVVELGPGVDGVEEGISASAEGHIVCGRCPLCRTGRAHVCPRTKILGIDRDGALAEFVTVPASNLMVTPSGISPEVACLQDALGNAVHCTSMVDPRGLDIAILGLGPIGLMTTAVARFLGASAIHAVEGAEGRAALGKTMGATQVLPPGPSTTQEIVATTEGLGPEVVYEMSGNPRALASALEMVRPGGSVVVLGIYPEPMALDITHHLVLKGVNLYGVTGRRMFGTWYRTRELLSAGLDISPVITHRFTLSDIQAAFGVMKSRECGKVAISVP
jgi:threonine 3-dehydrogenase